MTAPAKGGVHAAALQTSLIAGQVPTGMAERPEDVGWQGAPGSSTYTAYTVLWPDPGDPLPGSLGGRHSDLLLEFQVTAVGQTALQAMWMLDKARTVLLGTPPPVTGRQVWPLWQIDKQRAQRDDDETPAVFYAVAIFQMKSSPA